jgi:hypothetical protein
MASGIQQGAGAGQVGHIGVVLVGEHRVVGQAQLLGALDFGVPVRALDQRHIRRTPYLRAIAATWSISSSARGLVGLHGQPKAAPLRNCCCATLASQCFKHLQRQLQAVDLFGVNGQVDVGACGAARTDPDAGHQLGHDARTCAYS